MINMNIIQSILLILSKKEISPLFGWWRKQHDFGENNRFYFWELKNIYRLLKNIQGLIFCY